MSNNDDDDDDFCIDTNITDLRAFHECIREQALTKLRYISPTQAAIFTFIYTLISLLGTLGNGLVIFVVARRPEMRTTRNVFIVNLALSNFLLALILVPFLWLPTYRIEFPYGAFMCKVAQAFPSTNIFCSTLTVSVISVDRYFVVVRSRLGPGKVKSLQAVLIAAAIWIVSFALSILYLLHFHPKDYTLPGRYLPDEVSRQLPDDGLVLFTRCELKPYSCLRLHDEKKFDQEQTCLKFYEAALSALNALFIYIVPMPILVVFSCLLSRFLADNQRQHSSLRHRVCLPMARAAAGATTGGSGVGGVGAGANSLSAALLSAATSVIGRRMPANSNNNNNTSRPPTEPSFAATYRRRSRTTSLLFAMSFSNAILWLPFIVVSMFIQLAPSGVTDSFENELRQLDDAAKLISMLSICVNPFLYGYLNTNFNREFKVILAQCWPCLVGRDFYLDNNLGGGGRTTTLLSLRSSQPRTQGGGGGPDRKSMGRENESNSASLFSDQFINVDVVQQKYVGFENSEGGKASLLYQKSVAATDL